MTTTLRCDVLVVGGGPAGGGAAIPLAEAGHKVMVVDAPTHADADRRVVLVTPPAITNLEQLGATPAFHPIRAARMTANEVSNSSAWPDQPHTQLGAGVTEMATVKTALRDRARTVGVTWHENHEAQGAIVERGFLRGADVVDAHGDRRRIEADYTVIADGAISGFGRLVGTFRKPDWPYAVAHATRVVSGLHAAAEIELVVDLVDQADTPITGFGWLFPCGDGTAGVGVMLFSSSPSFAVLNPERILDELLDRQRRIWQLGERVGPTGGSRVPLGYSIRPTVGPTFLVVGDAAGAANPWSGLGIDPALNGARVAATLIDHAITTGTSAPLQRYPELVEHGVGSYYHVGRLANRVVRAAPIAHYLGRGAARHRAAVDGFVRLATDQVRPGFKGPAEIFLRLSEALALVAPDA